MMTWIKTIFLIVGGLFVIALAMAIVVIMTFDDEDYRQLAIRGVKVFTGTTIMTDGEFEVNLSAEPYLSAESIQITSAQRNRRYQLVASENCPFKSPFNHASIESSW